MKTVTALALLLLSSASAQHWTFSGMLDQPPCLDQVEAHLISTRWLSIFQTDSKGAGTGAALVETTLAPNFTYFDEGSTFGDPTPVYNSSAAVLESVSGTGYSGTLVTDVKYSIQHSFASCDTAVLRWQSNSKAANSSDVTVPVGTEVQYRGVDYLQVDLSTRLIYNATSSSDLLNYYIQLGDDVIAAMMPSS